MLSDHGVAEWSLLRVDSWILTSLYSSRVKQRPMIAISFPFPITPPQFSLRTSGGHRFCWTRFKLNLKSAKKRILQLINIMLMVPCPNVVCLRTMHISDRDTWRLLETSLQTTGAPFGYFFPELCMKRFERENPCVTPQLIVKVK